MRSGLRQIVLVRHGETAWSSSGRHTSVTDVPLTPAGREEAVRLAHRLAKDTFATVLTSPSQRAVETCALAGFGRRAEPCADLVEWNYGTYEGRTTAEIRAADPDWSLWRDGAPDGETPDAVAARVDRVLERIRGIDGNALLFAHGHVLRVLGARWLGLPPAGGRFLLLSPAAVSRLGYEREQPVLAAWNLTQ
jgi:broad specificity phosphatase PhoE